MTEPPLWPGLKFGTWEKEGETLLGKHPTAASLLDVYISAP